MRLRRANACRMRPNGWRRYDRRTRAPVIRGHWIKKAVIAVAMLLAAVWLALLVRMLAFT